MHAQDLQTQAAIYGGRKHKVKKRFAFALKPPIYRGEFIMQTILQFLKTKGNLFFAKFEFAPKGFSFETKTGLQLLQLQSDAFLVTILFRSRRLCDRKKENLQM